MEAELLDAFRATAHRVAQQEVAALVGTHGRDGDLGRLPELMQQVAASGLLAESDPGAPGFEYGVWGRACLTDGDEGSLLVLGELAEACAGVASCVHHAGLGALELGDSDAAGPVAVAMLGSAWPLTWESVAMPPPQALRDDGARLHGEATFVYAAPGTQTFVIYVAGPDGWRRVALPRTRSGVTCDSRGPRTGLAALDILSISLDAVEVDAADRLPARSTALYLRRLMLGNAAIALGNGRGAWRAAKAYARERYQGGSHIEAHASIAALLGGSAARLAAAQAHLLAAAHREGSANQRLWAALAARLQIAESCQRAVTDCMQALGGYGYMEDYRLEKRLRDAMTLACAAGQPAMVRAMCARDPEGEI